MVANPWGFVRHRRVDPPKRSVPERLRDWRVVLVDPPPEQLRSQATRCMDCGVAFCHAGCPLGNLIPEWNELTALGREREALERLHATNNFPEVTGYLCPAPCEPACVLAIDDQPVTIKSIELHLADRGWQEGWTAPVACAPATGRRVAVVGSGPAGLAAAQQLRRAGHAVVVYERDEAAGGLLRFGIPDFKFDKDDLDRRLAQIEAEGVELCCDVRVGSDDLPVERLRAEFDAVVLATGALRPRDVAVPGRDLAGVVQAMDYLPDANRVQAGTLGSPPVSAEGRRVLVLGGGDTAADCLGTANRQGATEVHVLDHNPRPPVDRDAEVNPWPEWPRVHRAGPAHEEGVVELWGTEVLAFDGDDAGRVRGVRVVDVERVHHAGGRREFRPVAGSERDVGADLVLLAVGFAGTDEGDLLSELGVDVDPLHGTVAVDGRWRTSGPDVWACGDAARGASLVVWAIAEGRAVAAAVDEALMGRTDLPAPVVPGQRPL